MPSAACACVRHLRCPVQAIGLHTDAEELQRAAAAAVPSPSPAARRHRPWPARPLHRRESGRNKSMSVNYSESDVDAFFGTERCAVRLH